MWRAARGRGDPGAVTRVSSEAHGNPTLDVPDERTEALPAISDEPSRSKAAPTKLEKGANRDLMAAAAAAAEEIGDDDIVVESRSRNKGGDKEIDTGPTGPCP